MLVTTAPQPGKDEGWVCHVEGHGGLIWEDCEMCGGTGAGESASEPDCPACGGEGGWMYCVACYAEAQSEGRAAA